jgi:YidC/Oxa1 family membrane protein insertase
MNTQKIFLFVAIFLTIFILWDKWEITQAIDANGNVVSKTAIVVVDSQDDAIDIPKASDVPLVSESTIEDNAPIMESGSNIQGAFTTVVTDLLTVEISHKGGTIINAYLNDYPNELNSEARFQLLSNSAGSIFHAQSGLIPADQMPTHQSEFTSNRKEYFLEGDSELIVPLSWTGDNGIQVTKNYHFKPNSYIIEVDYDVTNNSNEDKTVSSYTQLAHGNLIESSGFAMGMQNFNGGAIYNDEEVF